MLWTVAHFFLWIDDLVWIKNRALPYLEAKSTMLTRNNRSLPHLDPKLDRLIRKKGRRKKNGAIPLIPLYLPAKSTMLIVDFFSISLPAAFLDFWVNLGGGKDLRMQKVKTTDTRKRIPGPDPCICFVWKMQNDWNTRKCPQTRPLYLFDI